MPRNADEARHRVAINQLRHHYNSDLYEFGRHCLGNDWLVPHVHGDVSRWLADPSRKRFRLIMLPRESLKTTFISTARPVWRAAQDPDYNCMITSQSRRLSKAILTGIKTVIDKNERFRAVYGNLNGTNNGFVWNEEEATIATRSNTNIKEPTFYTGGVEVTTTGYHFKEIYADDLHDQINSQSSDQIKKVVNYLLSLEPLLDAKVGVLNVIGTFWSFDDAYTMLQAMRSEAGEEMFDCYIRPAALVDAKGDFSSILYPERLPSDKLREKRSVARAVGLEYFFNCQYLLDPMPTSNRSLRPEDWRVVDQASIPRDLLKFVIVDPSRGDGKDSDFTAAMTVGITTVADKFGHVDIYVLDGIHGRFGGAEGMEVQCSEIAAMYLRHKPIAVGIEKTGLGTLDIHLKNYLAAKGIYLSDRTLVDLKPGQRSKILRIRGLQPYSSNFKIHVSSELSPAFRKELESQAIRFEKTSHDDLIDCFAYTIDLIEANRELIEFTDAQYDRDAAELQQSRPSDSLSSPHDFGFVTGY